MSKTVVVAQRLYLPSIIATWALAAVLTLARIRGQLGGVDVVPFYQAGRAVLDGRPIYDVQAFVYPPFAAVAAVPFALLSVNHLYDLWSVLQVTFPLAACPLAALMVTKGRKAWLLSGVLAIILIKSDVLDDSLFLFNPTLLFALPAVAVPFLWSRSHWKIGCVLLGISLAIKPLLVLLLLAPIVQRRWSPLAWAIGTAASLTVIGLGVSHDYSGFLRLPRTIFSGTNLHGALRSHDVNLASVRALHPSFAILLWLAALAVVASVAMVTLGLRSENGAEELLASSAALNLALALLGSVDEIHYGVLGLFGTIGILWGWNRHRVAALLALVGAGVLVLPIADLGMSPLGYRESQVRWAIGQLLLVLAAGAYFCSVFVNSCRGRSLHRRGKDDEPDAIADLQTT